MLITNCYFVFLVQHIFGLIPGLSFAQRRIVTERGQERVSGCGLSWTQRLRGDLLTLRILDR